MIKQQIKINNETGLLARPATEISKVAMKYPCEVNIIFNGKTISAKSPLMIMSAGIKAKAEVEISCNGEGEEKALEEIKEIIENKLGE